MDMEDVCVGLDDTYSYSSFTTGIEIWSTAILPDYHQHKDGDGEI